MPVPNDSSWEGSRRDSSNADLFDTGISFIHIEHGKIGPGVCAITWYSVTCVGTRSTVHAVAETSDQETLLLRK